MARPTESVVAGRAVTRGVLAAALLGAACIDTELDGTSHRLPCARAMEASTTADSVLWLTIAIGDDYTRYCSAVAIAPRLVLTTFTCVSYPGDVDIVTAESPGPRFPRPTLDHFDPADYERFCDTADHWVPVEDGSLRSRYGGVVPRSALEVGLVGSTVPIAIDELMVAASSSRCTDGLALLLLSRELGLPSVPLRFVDLDRVGEPALMSSALADRGRIVRHVLDMEVLEVTDETGSLDTPPRSLLLTPSACQYERGAAVLSSSSGALIGLVSSGDGVSCDDTAGDTIALRVSAFRELLLGASTTYAQPLVAELDPNASGPGSVCP